jgi:Tol biopolymer transport system component/DNA-binding winged helix-turn-helix (wHTH) protein
LRTPEPYTGERRHRQYSFGSFTLDLDDGFLRRGAEEVALRPKPFDVLVYLVEHHGRLVTKAALTGAVWPDTAVMDNTLAQCLVEVRRALGDDSQQLIRTVTRRGYLFTAPVTTTVVEFPLVAAGAEAGPGPVSVPPSSQADSFAPTPPSHGRSMVKRVTLAILLAGTVLLGSLSWWMWRAQESSEQVRAVPLNSLPGMQHYPSFSPEGNHVAFTWTGPRQDNEDVYVQQIGSGTPLRLTTDPHIDYSPVWSPDGRWIAFFRRQWEAGTSELRLVPPLGGPERKLAEIRVRDTYYIIPPYLAWCPDSNCLVVTDSPGEGKAAALFVISLETGNKKQLTHPELPAIGDTNPAFSADSRWLVFRRQMSLEGGELYRLGLGSGGASAASVRATGVSAIGNPRRLTLATMDASYPAWIPNSKEILFSARGSLWRLVVPGENTPARLPFTGEDGIMPVVSPSRSGLGHRLVYVRHFQDSNIWRVQSPAAGARASAPPVVAISSTRMDSTPQFSPDGRRVAFASDRSGRWEIWLADPDGANALQLTSMGATSGAPCWSPGGDRVVFQSNPEGQFDIYVIPVMGGKPRNLTSHPASDGRPSFSRDGQWIYFGSNRGGYRQIWKIPASGGDAVRVTRNAGFAAFESPDGANLYYNETMEKPSPLWRQPVSGGIPSKVVEGVVRAAFAVIDKGVYYIDQPSGTGGLLYTDRPLGETRLQFFDFTTRRTTTVAGNLGNVFLGLTASRDGHAILYSRVDFSMDDLMLVDKFR